MRRWERIKEISTLKQKIMIIMLILISLCFWVYLQRNTDAYFKNNILVGIVGGASVVYNILFRDNQNNEKKEIVLCSVILSLMSLASNYQLFVPVKEHYFEVIVLFFSGIVVFFNISLALSTIALSKRNFFNNIELANRIQIIIFVGCMLIFCGYLFFVAYPGNLSVDSLEQMEQALGTIISNHHPIFHTVIIRFIVKIGIWLFGSINCAVALYSFVQLTFMAFVFSYVGKTLYQLCMPTRMLFILILPYCVLQYHFAYSVTMWKDIAFAGGVTLYITAQFRAIKKIGNQWNNTILLCFGALFFSLLRSNGLIVLIASALFQFGIIEKTHANRRNVICTFVIIMLAIFLKHPVIKFLDIKQPDIVEYLSIPEQQIARVIVEGKYIDECDKNELSKVYDFSSLITEYNPRVSNAVKENIRRTGADYLKEHKCTFFQIWVRIGLQYPSLYIKSWIDQTKGFWGIGYRYWILYHGIAKEYGYDENTMQSKTFGIYSNQKYCIFTDIYNRWIKLFEESAVFEYFRSIGIHFWLVLIIFFIGVMDKDASIILVSFPLIANMLTLIISTPVFCEFRYSYSIFTSFPFLMGVFLMRDRSQKCSGVLICKA